MTNNYDFIFDVKANDKFDQVFARLDKRRKEAQEGLLELSAVMERTFTSPTGDDSLLKALREISQHKGPIIDNSVNRGARGVAMYGAQMEYADNTVKNYNKTVEATERAAENADAALLSLATTAGSMPSSITNNITDRSINNSVDNSVNSAARAVAMYGSTAKYTEGQVSNFNNKVGETGERARTTKSSLQGLTSSMWRFSMLTGVAFSGYAIKEFVTDSVGLAASIDGMERGFNSLAGTMGLNGRQILSEIDALTEGTVSLEDTLQAANLAMFTQVREFGQALPTLAQMAHTAATAMGGDVGDIFERLIKGVARGSPKLIDDIGIFLKVGDAADEYARSLGKASVEELSTQERIQATLQAVLAQKDLYKQVGDEINKGPITQLQQMTRTIEDMKTTVGDSLIDIGAVNAAQTGLETLAGLFGEISVMANTISETAFFKWISRKKEESAKIDPIIGGNEWDVGIPRGLYFQAVDDLFDPAEAERLKRQWDDVLNQALYSRSKEDDVKAGDWARRRLEIVQQAIREQGAQIFRRQKNPLEDIFDAPQRPVGMPEGGPLTREQTVYFEEKKRITIELEKKRAEEALRNFTRPQYIDVFIRMNADSQARVAMMDQFEKDIASAVSANSISRAQAEAIYEQASSIWKQATAGKGFSWELDQAELKGQFDTLLQGTVDSNSDALQAAEQATKDSLERRKRLVEQFKDDVGNALKARSTPTDADFLATKMGLYQNAPMENLRRLQAIIDNGIDEVKRRHPDWVEALQIPSEALGSNDALRLWAMNRKAALDDLSVSLEDFKKNVDWGAFLENMRNIQTGRANKEANLQYAVEYAVANGVFRTAEEAQAAIEQEFGAASPNVDLKMKMPTTEELSAQVDTAMKNVDWGGSLYTAWESSIKNQQTSFADSGKKVADWFSQGFLSALRTNLTGTREEIARLILPAVMTALQPAPGTRSQ